MKAIIRDAYGSADVLTLTDVETPVPGEDDVLLRVRAAGVDMGVWHMVTGVPYVMRVATGLRAPKAPWVGGDVAGEVEAVGAAVTAFKPGDRVFGTCNGAYAEFARTPQDRLARIPDNLTFEQAAALPTSGMTALQALRDVGRVRPGQRVLVIGAGGGVGTFAVQLAKVFGAEVTGVCSTSKVDLVRSIGADDVVDYTREDFADGKRRYDLILVTGGNRSLSHLRRALTPRGTFVIIGGEGGGRWLAGMDLLLRTVLLVPFTRQNPRVIFALPKQENLRTLAELAGGGKITPVVERTYPLSDVPEAFRELETRHARGKMVITV
ncbi:NAD(P)-dependent alcohol dehydrogenase [Nonomuraea sp. SYSU D8015]|uniref:NAD(P)-dependent alcohol dehydrogenase n=1 Tax=Nonomuraea sp. SYSU D8015 TaxID=2593644 RepID=UPI0016617C98|nr:NAD(P)-dependent alcohol dehydrogenase [Nonomuraea sp. SYSU D8015]